LALEGSQDILKQKALGEEDPGRGTQQATDNCSRYPSRFWEGKGGAHRKAQQNNLKERNLGEGPDARHTSGPW
jgi:hypothetical protein